MTASGERRVLRFLQKLAVWFIVGITFIPFLLSTVTLREIADYAEIEHAMILPASVSASSAETDSSTGTESLRSIQCELPPERGNPNLTNITLPEFPSFIIIGAHKGGTTALYQILQSHPNILPSRKQEGHFFDSQSGLLLRGNEKRVMNDEGFLCGVRNHYSYWLFSAAKEVKMERRKATTTTTTPKSAGPDSK
jgi:hypothetical protein